MRQQDKGERTHEDSDSMTQDEWNQLKLKIAGLERRVEALETGRKKETRQRKAYDYSYVKARAAWFVDQLSDKGHTPRENVYDAYCRASKLKGLAEEDILSDNTFGKALKRLDVKSKRINGIWHYQLVIPGDPETKPEQTGWGS